MALTYPLTFAQFLGAQRVEEVTFGSRTHRSTRGSPTAR
jgi:hypothetical protein